MGKNNKINNQENDTAELINPSGHKKPLFLILVVALVVFFFTVGFILGKYTTLQNLASPTTTLQSTSNQLGLAEIQRLNKEKLKKTSEKANTFENSTLLQHPELQQTLRGMEIQLIKEFLISPSNITAWVIDAIDKSYLEGNQTNSDDPRHQYLVTPTYWEDMQGSLAVECLTKRIFPITVFNDVKQVLETKNLLVEWGCSSAASVSLFDLQTGKKIPLSDPKNLVLTDKPSIVDGEGNSSGLVEFVVSGKKPIFQISYGDPVPSGTGVFSAETGQLLNLVIFDQFTQ